MRLSNFLLTLGAVVTGGGMVVADSLIPVDGLVRLEKRQNSQAFTVRVTGSVRGTCEQNGLLPCGTRLCMRQGWTCCPTGTWGCPAGSYCLVQSVCCPNGLDPATCATNYRVTLPATYGRTTTTPATSPAAATSSPATSPTPSTTPTSTAVLTSTTTTLSTATNTLTSSTYVTSTAKTSTTSTKTASDVDTDTADATTPTPTPTPTPTTTTANTTTRTTSAATFTGAAQPNAVAAGGFVIALAAGVCGFIAHI